MVKRAKSGKLEAVIAIDPALKINSVKESSLPVYPEPTAAPIDRFDEAFYLGKHPDVAEAVARGDWGSGLMHYAIAGYANGRVAAPSVDTDWYTATYPAAALDIAAGRACDITDHYYRIGRYRGYLPDAAAIRPENPAEYRSRFGGFWTDQRNAMDLVEGRLDLGIITLAQAELLQKWITDGYVIIPGTISEDIVSAAVDDLDRAYHGRMPDMRFEIHGVGRGVPWAQEALTNPAKALDLHWHSEAARNLIFAPAVLDFLHQIFDRRVLASQTLGFWRGSQQNGHQDTAYVNYSLPMQFAASWIALEDVVEGAGELFYHVGSHRIAEYRFLSTFKGVVEAARVRGDSNEIKRQIDEHLDRIALQATGLKLKTGRLLAKRGEALIWAADLAHGGSPISAAHTRKSLVTHYCPIEVAPSYFEMNKSEIRSHGRVARYSSGHYGNAG
jgi:phytanoyl-CoA hydroxylase